jgi:hypothetical protein
MSNRPNDFNFDDDELQFPDDDIFSRQNDDLPDLDFEEEEQRGPNRAFIIVAVLMILLFVVGLGAIIFLTTREQPIPPAGLTATFVVMQNMTVEAQLNLTQTQSAINLGLTQTADAFTDTPSPTATNTRPPTITPTPTLDATVLALTQLAAVDLTGTALALVPTETATPTQGTGVDADAVALTATALALTLQAPRPTLPPEQTLVATRLPETGLYDDLTGGGAGGLGVVALMAFGLLGVIVVSRRIRANVNHKS